MSQDPAKPVLVETRHVASIRWLLGGVGAMLLLSLFNHPLIPSMEPRFAEAVREMIARGQYLIPIKNGVPYIEYPPLYFWLCILGKFIGLPDTAAVRLPAAIAFLFWIHGLFRLQKLLKPEWPPLLLPLAGAALPIALANYFQAQTDGLLALGVLIAMIGYCEHHAGQSEEVAAKFPWKFWLGTTLAVAAKGPVGLVLTIFPVAAERITSVLVAKSPTPLKEIWRRGFALFPMRGLALVLLINGPWYLAAGLREGWDFCRAVLIYQNFTRFFVGFDHLQPWWYYLKTISYDLFPYSLLLPFGLYFAWRNRTDFTFRFSTAWILTTVVFFTLSHSKQGKYLLPTAPAALLFGLLSARALWPKSAGKIESAATRLASVLLALFSAALITLSIWLKPEMTGATQLSAVHAAMKPPGRLFVYRWPRSQVLYEFGAPLPWVRNDLDLYKAIHDGVIRPGDYLLVSHQRLFIYKHPWHGDLSWEVPLSMPYFETAASDSKNRYDLHRVRPEVAAGLSPPTYGTTPAQWWEKFDTD